MMYRHSVTVYDRDFDLVATISDEVTPSDFGHALEGSYRGAPVEAAATPDGRYVYVSNYSMYGPGFREGNDTCTPQDGYEDSFVYRIDAATGEAVATVSTGQAPRSAVLSADGTALYVVNYESDTVAKVRTSDMSVVQTVEVGHHPIGITVDEETRQVWVACYSGTIAVFQDGQP